jgi:L-lactate dehydrogenase complex protein LldG
LLPPVHIAIVERAQIVPDLFDMFAILGRQIETGLPTNLAFITGPSKTGDIELTLITGVHGPGKWHVIVIR